MRLRRLTWGGLVAGMGLVAAGSAWAFPLHRDTSAAAIGGPPSVRTRAFYVPHPPPLTSVFSRDRGVAAHGVFGPRAGKMVGTPRAGFAPAPADPGRPSVLQGPRLAR